MSTIDKLSLTLVHAIEAQQQARAAFAAAQAAMDNANAAVEAAAENLKAHAAQRRRERDARRAALRFDAPPQLAALVAASIQRSNIRE
jgi:hypothetical protein